MLSNIKNMALQIPSYQFPQINMVMQILLNGRANIILDCPVLCIQNLLESQTHTDDHNISGNCWSVGSKTGMPQKSLTLSVISRKTWLKILYLLRSFYSSTDNKDEHSGTHYNTQITTGII